MSMLPDDVVEVCPVLFVPAIEVGFLSQTVLYDYYYAWEEDAVIALGHGSLYNHSYDPNATYRRNPAQQEMIVTAIKPINCGDEIFINYNGKPEDRTIVWFEEQRKKTETEMDRELRGLCSRCGGGVAIKCLNCRYKFCSKCLLEHLSDHHPPGL